MLEVKKLSVTYNGNIKALKSVNLHVQMGEIVVLIGANGAGKTTLLKALTGLVKVDSGSFANLDLTGLKDKRTLNRFAGTSVADKLLEEYESSEKVFEILQRASDDFEKRSRIGFFMQYSKKLQEYLRKKYPLIKMHIRFKDDDVYFYYLIFETPEEQSLAEDEYGISNIVNSVHEFCSRDDMYHVFDSFVPMPYITTKGELEKQGKVLSIIRDNPDFTRAWD